MIKLGNACLEQYTYAVKTSIEPTLCQLDPRELLFYLNTVLSRSRHDIAIFTINTCWCVMAKHTHNIIFIIPQNIPNDSQYYLNQI